MTARSTLATIAGCGVAILAAAPANAEERTCRGTIGDRTVDNLRVPDDARCVLRGTRVEGTVKVETGAVLRAHDIRVIGNVQAENHRRVLVAGGSRVGGSVQIVQGHRFTLRRTTVGSDVQVFENHGRIRIRNNEIDGNLQCKENRREPSGGNNRVGGNKEDQCRRL
jgi:hypothetical protein